MGFYCSHADDCREKSGGSAVVHTAPCPIPSITSHGLCSSRAKQEAVWPRCRGDSGIPRLSPGRGAGEERDREPREEQGRSPGIWDQGDATGDGPRRIPHGQRRGCTVPVPPSPAIPSPRRVRLSVCGTSSSLPLSL